MLSVDSEDVGDGLNQNERGKTLQRQRFDMIQSKEQQKSTKTSLSREQRKKKDSEKASERVQFDSEGRRQYLQTKECLASGALFFG